jgi:hypothetical protein
MKPIRNHTLMAACLIIAAYMILDGLTFMLNPFSGRISTFACKTADQTGTLCTVTIYGLREIYRKSFTPDEFFRAIVIRTEPGVSGKESYGVTIQTLNETINYIYHINPPAGMQQKASQINSLFADGAPVPDTLMVHLGLDSSIYRRIFFILLTLGMAWFVSRINPPSFWTVSSIKVHRNRLKTLVYSWMGADFLVRLGFILITAFIFGCNIYYYSVYLDDFVSACRGVYYWEPQLFQFPWGYLLCLSPLIFILVMQALLHRQLLARLNINVSAWWIAAPLLAVPVLPVITPDLICNDCWELKYLMVGLVQDYEAPINTALVAYFLLLGLIQWLVLRKELPRSIAWIPMPLINAMLVLLAYLVFDYTLPEPGILVALILLTIIIGMLIPALTMSWLVIRKGFTPDSGA